MYCSNFWPSSLLTFAQCDKVIRNVPGRGTTTSLRQLSTSIRSHVIYFKKCHFNSKKKILEFTINVTKISILGFFWLKNN